MKDKEKREKTKVNITGKILTIHVKWYNII